MSSRRCLVMGILNRTPDSFYDGGRTGLVDSLAHAGRMAAAGADIIDVGGVKAGLGAQVSKEEELDRVLPVVQGLRAEIDARLSVETSRPSVAAAALEAGASIVNDVTGLAEPGLAAACARGHGKLVLMHHGGQIRGRPRNPRYEDVVTEVLACWARLAQRAESEGLGRHDLIADPGLDFGKTTFHSLELMRRLPELIAGGLPLLIAASRKDVVGETLDLPPGERLEGSLALVALATFHGAAFVRVHDVQASVRVVRMVETVLGTRSPAAPVRGLWD